MSINLREKIIYYLIWLAFELGSRKTPSFIRALDRSNYTQFALYLMNARLLAQAGRLGLAAAEYNRCLEQRPNDQQVASELRQVLRTLSLGGQQKLVQQILQAQKGKKSLSLVDADDLTTGPQSAEEGKKFGSSGEIKKIGKTTIGALWGFVSLLIMGGDDSPDPDGKESLPDESPVSGAQAADAQPLTPRATGPSRAPLPGAALPAGPPSRGSGRQTAVSKRLDAVFSAIDVIHSTMILILRRNYALRQTGVFKTAFRTIFLIIAHVYMWDLLGRTFPPGIASYWWVTGGFAAWILITTGFTKSHSKEYLGQWYIRNHIPFGAIFVQDMLFEVSMTILGIFLSFVFLYMLNQRRFYDSSVNLDYPMICELLLLSYFVGVSLGAILNASAKALGISAFFSQYVMWPIFITSGVYDNFHSAPSFAQNIMALNPAVHIVEYLRRAFDPQYSVEGLTLVYPVGLSLIGVFIYSWSMLNNMQEVLKRSRVR